MSSLFKSVKNIKRYPKWKWQITYTISCFFVYELLKIYFPLFKDVFFHGAASLFFIYNTFFIDTVRLKFETKKQQLMIAFMGGAFVWMFIESVSKLFAKWVVWKFF